MASEPRRKRKPRYERRIFALALLTGLPAVVLALVLLWTGDFAPRTQWTVTILMVGVWLAFVAAVRERVVRPLQTISNMLAALREGDFSLRARGSDPDDALGLLLVELNSLGEDLRAQRLGALEATALLRRVMEEIDVAVFAFDSSQALRLVNRAGAALLGRPREQALGRGAAELGLGPCFTAEAPGVVELELAGARGRWEGRRGTLRQEGLPPELLAVAEWVRRVAALETRRAVVVCPGPDVTIQADGAQLDQLLINLVRNAVDASLESNAEVEVSWAARNGLLEVWVRDGGPGLADTGNLFVPFFTTKPTGSGIGLVLSRQIAEAHGGTLTLANRVERRGCEARLSLPIAG